MNDQITGQEITFNSYQNGTQATAKYPSDIIPDPLYLVLGMVGESGEVAEKIKKLYRDNKGVIPSPEWKEDMKKELGDVLYYLAALAWMLDIPLEDIAVHNQAKLLSRLQRGVLHGSGDNR
jgi:NTP pyrophosphatase (non-canonical NTP hydrolase)